MDHLESLVTGVAFENARPERGSRDKLVPAKKKNFFKTLPQIKFAGASAEAGTQMDGSTTVRRRAWSLKCQYPEEPPSFCFFLFDLTIKVGGVKRNAKSATLVVAERKETHFSH